MYRFPPDATLDLRLRLFSDYIVDYLGRDVFALFAEQRYAFFEISGESPETFTFVNEITLPTCEQCTLSKKNSVHEYVFIRLLTYPTIE